jgi:hypothetical protein
MTTLALDLTAKLSNNLIVEEVQAISFNNNRQLGYVVTANVLFFIDDLIVDVIPTIENKSLKPKNIRSRLNCWIDYIPALKYSKGSDVCGKIIYAGITLVDSTLQGNLLITNRAMGGAFQIDRRVVINKIGSDDFHLVRDRYDSLLSNSVVFSPPLVPFNKIQQSSISSLISSAIDANSTMVAAPLPPSELYLVTHTSAINPHRLSAKDIDLGSVPNWRTATDDQAALGVARNLFVTPSGAAKAVKSGISVPQASVGSAGTITLNNPTTPDETSATKVLTAMACRNLRSLQNSSVKTYLSNEKKVLTFNFTTYDLLADSDFSMALTSRVYLYSTDSLAFETTGLPVNTPAVHTWSLIYPNGDTQQAPIGVRLRCRIRNFSDLAYLVMAYTGNRKVEHCSLVKKIWLPPETVPARLTLLSELFSANSLFPMTIT